MEEEVQEGSRFSRLREKLTPSRLNVSRLVYSIFIVFGYLLALLLRDRFFNLIPTEQCSRLFEAFGVTCAGKYFVYRISASLVVFFTIFAFLSSRAFFVGDRIRLYIHYKWFAVKIALFILLMGLPMILSDSIFYIYAWVALFMSVLFLIVQVVLLVDSAHSWQEDWRSDEESGKTIWDYLLLVVSFLAIAISITFVVVGFVYFGSKAPCHVNRFFLCFTIVLGVAVIAASVLANKGILPGSIVCCYCAYLCWSALMSDPSKECNTLMGESHDPNVVSNIITTIVGLLIACISLIRTAVSTGGGFSKFFSLKNSNVDQEQKYLLNDQIEEDKGEEENREECHQVFSSHVVFILMSFYMAMVLCNWEIEHSKTEAFETDKSLLAMWAKITCQWLTVLVFGWTLLAPRILSKYRSFD